MQNKKAKLMAALMLCFGFTGLQAQNAVSSTGLDASGCGGTASYTIGQMAYSAFSETNNNITQGVQQPFEILVISEISEAEGITLVFKDNPNPETNLIKLKVETEIAEGEGNAVMYSVYPNPATNFVKLKVENCTVGNLSYQLYNISGILLESSKIIGSETNISMSNLVPSTYFLKIKNNDKEMKIFKIIKNY
jgi:hypothetical protein